MGHGSSVQQSKKNEAQANVSKSESPQPSCRQSEDSFSAASTATSSAFTSHASIGAASVALSSTASRDLNDIVSRSQRRARTEPVQDPEASTASLLFASADTTASAKSSRDFAASIRAQQRARLEQGARSEPLEGELGVHANEKKEKKKHRHREADQNNEEENPESSEKLFLPLTSSNLDAFTEPSSKYPPNEKKVRNKVAFASPAASPTSTPCGPKTSFAKESGALSPRANYDFHEDLKVEAKAPKKDILDPVKLHRQKLKSKTSDALGMEHSRSLPGLSSSSNEAKLRSHLMPYQMNKSLSGSALQTEEHSKVVAAPADVRDDFLEGDIVICESKLDASSPWSGMGKGRVVCPSSRKGYLEVNFDSTGERFTIKAANLTNLSALKRAAAAPVVKPQKPKTLSSAIQENGEFNFHEKKPYKWKDGGRTVFNTSYLTPGDRVRNKDGTIALVVAENENVGSVRVRWENLHQDVKISEVMKYKRRGELPKLEQPEPVVQRVGAFELGSYVRVVTEPFAQLGIGCVRGFGKDFKTVKVQFESGGDCWEIPDVDCRPDESGCKFRREGMAANFGSAAERHEAHLARLAKKKEEAIREELRGKEESRNVDDGAYEKMKTKLNELKTSELGSELKVGDHS